jgi:hypothetical protein
MLFCLRRMGIYLYIWAGIGVWGTGHDYQKALKNSSRNVHFIRCVTCIDHGYFLLLGHPHLNTHLTCPFTRGYWVHIDGVIVCRREVRISPFMTIAPTTYSDVHVS